MKGMRHSLAVSILFLSALGLVSCQRVFTYSPLDPLFPDAAYSIPANATTDQVMDLATEALASGDPQLAAVVLANLMDRYGAMGDAQKAAALDDIARLALLTTNVSGALTDAMQSLPTDGSEVTEAQADAIQAAMANIAVSDDAMAAFGLMLEAESAAPGTVDGGDCVFAGMALLLSVANDQPGASLDDLSEEDLGVCLAGMALVGLGMDSLTAEGADTSMLEGIVGFIGA
jgi:hypothetical protein